MRCAAATRLAIDVVPDGDTRKPGLQPDWNPNPGDAWYWLAEVIDAHPRLRIGAARDLRLQRIEEWLLPLDRLVDDHLDVLHDAVRGRAVIRAVTTVEPRR